VGRSSTPPGQFSIKAIEVIRRLRIFGQFHLTSKQRSLGPVWQLRIDVENDRICFSLDRDSLRKSRICGELDEKAALVLERRAMRGALLA
jgi:hypothetical protein